MENNYIWLFGENEAKTANNNSYFFWKKVVNIEDGIEKYFVLQKNKKNRVFYNSLSAHERKYILWRNSYKHYKKYFDADMFFVTLSYLDVVPNAIMGHNVKLIIKKPVIYLQHGTLGIKKIGYNGSTYNNNMFRFFIYNKKIKQKYMEENNFKEYQLYCTDYHPRYMGLLEKEEIYKEKNQILLFLTWREYFGKNVPTDLFVRNIRRIVKSSELKEFLDKENLTFKICMHSFFDRDVLKIVYDAIDTDRIEIVSSNEIDVMDELAKSTLLVTDYSSVGFDFTFLNKPVILFQPDREAYLKKRSLYCEIDELENCSVTNVTELIDTIVNKKFGINPFFKSRMLKKFDYEYVKSGSHIMKMYEDMKKIQLNKITFIGYNFTGIGGTVNATRSLAEGLLEQGYLVSLLSLKKTGKPKNLPYGLNLNYIYFQKTKSIKEKICRKLHNSKKNLSYLVYDVDKNNLHPYIGYELPRILNRIRSNTVVSTRETLHLFLNDCTSQKVKNKIYFFHTPCDVLSDSFPEVMNQIKTIRLQKAVFVTDKIRLEHIEKNNYQNYDDYLISGNAIEQTNMIEMIDIKHPVKRDVYKAIYLLRITKDRIDDLRNLINFGIYVKNHNINNIKIDVYGQGDYTDEFLDELENNDLMEIIYYKGSTATPAIEIRKHDLMIDFTINHSFGMTYIEAILNGKKVFCVKNTGSLEVMKDIPNSYFEDYDDLCNKINNFHKTTKKELTDNYKKICERYSREVVAKKFIDFIEK